MTQTYWPFDNADTTETQYSQLFRRLQNTGVWGDPLDNTLKVLAGAGMTVTLKAGYAFIRGHMYYNDADVAIVIPGGSASARVDRIVLRLDPAENTITPVIIAGVPGSPNPSAMTQTDAAQYDLELCQISVAASATNLIQSNIADKRTFMGHIYGLWTTDGRPAAPRRGQPGYNHTTSSPEYWDGSDWKSFTPATIPWSALTDIPATFTPAAHDINGTSHTGTLAINKGGTGVTTKALIDVGMVDGKAFKIQQADPGGPDNTVWIGWV